MNKEEVIKILKEFDERTNSHIFDFHTVSAIQKSKELQEALKEAIKLLSKENEGENIFIKEFKKRMEENKLVTVKVRKSKKGMSASSLLTAIRFGEGFRRK